MFYNSGVGAEIYWISNYVWDMFNFLLPTSVSVIVFYAFQQEAFVQVRDYFTFFLLSYYFPSRPDLSVLGFNLIDTMQNWVYFIDKGKS